MSDRLMHMVGYYAQSQAQCTAMWSHPFSRTDFLGKELAHSVARTLEAGCFDMVFMADSLSVPDSLGGTFDVNVEYGGQGSVQLDPIVNLTMMAAVTEHIGLGATCSTTFIPAFQLARQLGSMDHLSGGRAAWNIITSAHDAVAKNFGMEVIPPPSARYDYADDVVEAVCGLWTTWEAGAFLADKDTGRMADPTKVHYLNYAGEHGVKVRGPLTMPRSPQGRPVLMQAGASDRGMAFGARWGELIFAMKHSPADMKAYRTEMRRRAAAIGRDPDTLRILPAMQVIVGETETIAKDKQAFLNDSVPIPAGLSLLSNHSGADLSAFPLDTPLVEVIERLGGPGGRGTYRLLADAAAQGVSTLLEAVRLFGTSELTPQFVGTPKQVAGQLAEIFHDEAVDGWVLTPTVMPGTFEDFVRSVVPELQRMGVMRTEYRGRTLRENLGLPPVDAA